MTEFIGEGSGEQENAHPTQDQTLVNGLPTAVRFPMLRVDEVAPPFEAIDTSGTTVRLADFRGQKNVVLFFYPKSFTPGCTREVCAFRDAYEELTGVDAVLIGVSLDPMELQRRFVQQFKLPFVLLSDQDQRIGRAYGAVGFLGGMLGVARRITFVIDKQGIVRGAFRHELAISRHVEDVRAALQTLS